MKKNTKKAKYKRYVAILKSMVKATNLPMYSHNSANVKQINFKTLCILRFVANENHNLLLYTSVYESINYNVLHGSKFFVINILVYRIFKEA